MDSCSCLLEKMELKKLIQEDLLKLSDLRNIKTTEIVINSNGKGGVIYVFMSSLEATGYLNRGKVAPKIDRSLVLLRVVGHTLI